MSEFAAIVQLLGQIVHFIFRLSLNLISTIFLLVSFILPWRIYEIVNHDDDIHNYNEFCWENFFKTLYDIWLIPFALVTTLSPLRAYYLYLEWKVSLEKFREAILLLCLPSLLDLVSLLLVPFVILNPIGRQFTSLQFVICEYQFNKFDDIVFDFLFISIALKLPLDILYLLGSIPSLLVPTTWSILIKGYILSCSYIKNIYDLYIYSIYINHIYYTA
jgi:hypothetical protein